MREHRPFCCPGALGHKMGLKRQSASTESSKDLKTPGYEGELPAHPKVVWLQLSIKWVARVLDPTICGFGKVTL